MPNNVSACFCGLKLSKRDANAKQKADNTYFDLIEKKKNTFSDFNVVSTVR